MRVWTVSEEKAGTLTQCVGVANLLVPDPSIIKINGALSFWRRGPLSPYKFAPAAPQPDIVISCGWSAASHVSAIAAACRRKPFTVHLAKPPPEYRAFFDLVYVSRHDWSDEMGALSNFRRMIGVPNRISREHLNEIRSQARQTWAPAKERVATVLLGGSNRAYEYTGEAIGSIIESIEGLAAQGWTLLVSTSRRSASALRDELLRIRGERIVVWDGNGSNPYQDFLAAADALVVAKDSITMACEAVTTGKPTFILDLPGKNSSIFQKFERFHADLISPLSFTRRFEGHLFHYDFQPPTETRRIAGEITDALTRKASV